MSLSYAVASLVHSDRAQTHISPASSIQAVLKHTTGKAPLPKRFYIVHDTGQPEVKYAIMDALGELNIVSSNGKIVIAFVGHQDNRPVDFEALGFSRPDLSDCPAFVCVDGDTKEVEILGCATPAQLVPFIADQIKVDTEATT